MPNKSLIVRMHGMSGWRVPDVIRGENSRGRWLIPGGGPCRGDLQLGWQDDTLGQTGPEPSSGIRRAMVKNTGRD